MKNIVPGLKKNWHVMRIVRLLFALTMLVSFFTSHDTIALFGAAFFGYQAIFNAGCCSMQECNPKTIKGMKQPEAVEYEEIKTP